MEAALLEGEPQELAERIVQIHEAEPSWLDEFAAALDRARAGSSLARILDAWGLSQAELARLFGVTRQAIGKWLERGVPAERIETIADLAAATDLLVLHLKRDRIPAVVRRKSAALGKRSLLDLVAASRHRDVLEACRSMFAFDRAQA